MRRRLLNRRPGRYGAVLLGTIPFALLTLVYLAASRARLAENPNDKVLPAPEQFAAAIWRAAFEPSRRTGDYLLWVDTLASLQRIGLGVATAAITALIIGILTGLLPYARAGASPLIKAISLIPPLAVLPILFITFGLGETAKVMLIVFGITPMMIRDLQQRTLEIPEEQLIKAQTLGANTGQILLRVALPQILPRLIEAVRLGLGPAWLFLIAAEAIAAEEGLGYRIFLLRRYLAMDTILPYVAWITLIAFSVDTALRLLRRRAFPWTGASA